MSLFRRKEEKHHHDDTDDLRVRLQATLQELDALQTKYDEAQRELQAKNGQIAALQAQVNESLLQAEQTARDRFLHWCGNWWSSFLSTPPSHQLAITGPDSTSSSARADSSVKRSSSRACKTLAIYYHLTDSTLKLLGDILLRRLETELASQGFKVKEYGEDDLKHPNDTVVLFVAFASGARLSKPAEAKKLVRELKDRGAVHVALCVLRYGDRPDSLSGESAEDLEVHPETSVAGKPLSVMLLFFKDMTACPLNERGLAQLTAGLGRL